MSNREKAETRFSLWERYIWLLAAAWTLIIVASAVWNVRQVKASTLENARIQAQIAFEKDVLYRRWNAEHGGVYVPVTEETQPNPYLADLDERDITAPSGTQLTLMNPAYMTRQVHERAAQEQGVFGHITSLDPIRPENAADPWETEALRAFERGENVVSSVEDIEGESYMRLMRPFVTEAACLPCHAAQGYQVGDIRGGISVSVPMEPLLAVSREQVRALGMAHGLLWLVGLVGIVLSGRHLRRTEQRRDHLISDLDAYARTVAHDLKNPLHLTVGYAGLLIEDLDDPALAEQHKMVQRIQINLSEMGRVVDALLLLSMVEVIKDVEVSRLDMAQIVGDVRERLKPMIETHQAEVTVPDPWPDALGFAPWVEAIWANYLSNALKYGGQPPQITLGADAQNGVARFWMRDNGPGLSAEEQARLFVPFTRLQRLKEGHGLGLSIVQRVVEALGGQAGVESAPGEGSTFWFTLPTA